MLSRVAFEQVLVRRDSLMWCSQSCDLPGVRKTLNDQNQLWCFGHNVYGQLGLGNTDNKSSPTHVSSLGSEVEAFSVGSSYIV